MLILPSASIARHPLSPQTRSRLEEQGVKLHEVQWIRPDLGEGIPKWAQEFWCVDRDFFKLHVLSLDYDAVVFYDSDVIVDPPGWQHLEELIKYIKPSKSYCLK